MVNPIPTPAAPAARPAGPRTVLLAGATGLVGRELLDLLLADEQVTRVDSIGRRPPPRSHPKLTHHSADFQQLAALALPPVTDCVIALGTTIAVAGSEAAFRAVDFDAVVATARMGRTCGATHLGVVSAMGADARSRVFYNRVKGEMEAAVSALGYTSVVFARPSLLQGDRSSLARAARPREDLVQPLMRWLAPVLPADWRAIPAARVARALLTALWAAQPGVRVMRSGELQKG